MINTVVYRRQNVKREVGKGRHEMDSTRMAMTPRRDKQWPSTTMNSGPITRCSPVLSVTHLLPTFELPSIAIQIALLRTCVVSSVVMAQDLEVHFGPLSSAGLTGSHRRKRRTILYGCGIAETAKSFPGPHWVFGNHVVVQ